MNERASKAQVLVVDDEDVICRTWLHMLNTNEFEVSLQPHAEGACEWLAAHPTDVVIADVNMNVMSGLDLLHHIKRTCPAVQVIIMTGKGNYDDAVSATRAGAFHYITKPFHDLEACVSLVRSAAKVKRLEDEVLQLRSRMDGGVFSSQSQAMQPVLNRAERVAPTMANLMLSGPTGSGKSALARAIHQRSGRVGAFVHVDCGALPPQLVESMLFGHKRGSFTGADDDHSGFFRDADKGTIFLDEVGNMPMSAQPKLLTVVQERCVKPIGGAQSIDVDVRIISATNVNLAEAVEAGEFREDLYWRLKVVELRLPNLSERFEDIGRIALQLMREAAEINGLPMRTIASDCLTRLQNFDWPGNIRQLKNVIEAAVVLSNDATELTVEHLPDEIIGRPSRTPPPMSVGALFDLDEPWGVAVTAAENAVRAAYIRGLLERFDHNLTKAAAHAGKDRANFRKLRNRYLPGLYDND